MRRRLALALALSLIAGGAAAQDRQVRLPDGRRIHLDCQGKGKVTAVLEAGFGADGGEWYAVQPKLAKTMRVCSYDRAASRGSGPGPYPRDGAAIAKDLDQALRAAGIKGPLIGVGHSSGGLYMRIFAARRLPDMKGLVLVDPSVEHAGGIEGIRREALACQRFTERTPLDQKDPMYGKCISNDPEQAKASRSPDKWRSQVSEIETLFTTTSDQVDIAQKKISNVPTIILTAEQGGMLEPHRIMKERFVHAEQRVIPSGHMMMFEKPDAIVQAVKDLARR
ncbi:MAG TPA: alpha/beta hydrolase [Caulobacteraceae bacterium]|nr:alpha/beta hydrolase [Caulobacteraceae bacterium]